MVDFDTTSPLDMDKVKSAEEAISKYSGVLFGGGVDLTEGNKSVDSGARQWWSTAQSREEAVRKHLLPLRDAVTMSTAWSDLPVLRKVDFAAAEKVGMSIDFFGVCEMKPIFQGVPRAKGAALHLCVCAARHGGTRGFGGKRWCVCVFCSHGMRCVNASKHIVYSRVASGIRKQAQLDA